MFWLKQNFISHLLRWELAVKVETTGQVVSWGSGRPPPPPAQKAQLSFFSTSNESQRGGRKGNRIYSPVLGKMCSNEIGTSFVWTNTYRRIN